MYQCANAGAFTITVGGCRPKDMQLALRLAANGKQG